MLPSSIAKNAHRVERPSATFATAKVRLWNSVQVEHGLGVARAAAHERTRRGRSATARHPMHRGRRPSPRRALGEREDERAERGEREQRAEVVRRRAASRRRRALGSTERPASQAMRPIGRLTKNTQRQPPAVTRSAPSVGPVATASAPTPLQRATASVRRSSGHRGEQEAERRGQHRRGAAALHDAPGVEQLERRGDAAQRRAGAEDGEPGEEDAARAEPVGRASGDDEQRAEGDRVARDDPGERGRAGPRRTSARIAGKAMLTIDRSSDAMKAPSAVTRKTATSRSTRRRVPPAPALSRFCHGNAP